MLNQLKEVACLEDPRMIHLLSSQIVSTDSTAIESFIPNKVDGFISLICRPNSSKINL